MKKKRNFVTAKDVIFGFVVHDDIAEVVAEQGLVGLMTEADHKWRRPPDGVVFDTEQYGLKYNVIIRDITDDVILELGPDDYYEKDMTEKSKVMPLESTGDVEELFNELKIQTFTKKVGTIATFFAGIILSVACYFLLKKGFVFPLAAKIGMWMGVPVGIVFGLVPFIRMFQCLNCDYIADAAGHWVNVKTGKTNLNGGIKIPTEGV